jgi:hypothetical protein
MGQGLLALLPLLTAGFMLSQTLARLRLITASFDGQRMFFVSAACGLALAMVSFPITGAVREVIPEAVQWASVYPMPYAADQSLQGTATRHGFDAVPKGLLRKTA